MRRTFRAAAAALGVAAAAATGAPAAWAQGAVQQLSPVTAGHLSMWAGSGHLMDAGGPTRPGGSPVNTTQVGAFPTGAGFVNSGLGECQFSNYATSPYSRLCWGFDGSGNALFAIDRVGGGLTPSLSFKLNGITYPFPGTGNGNVLGPSSPPTVVGDAVIWNNTAGTLVADAGGPPVLGPASSTIGDVALFNNTAGTLIADGGPPTITVATNAALRALSPGQVPTVVRAGFAARGDTDPLSYNWNASCPGTPDNGAYVAPSAVSAGCWAASFPAAGLNPKQWGVVGDGTTDDSTAWQAVLNYAQTINATILIPPGVLSNITVPLVATLPVIIRGQFTTPGNGVGACPNGFTTRSNINLLTLNGVGSEITHTCFQMGTSGARATAGAAITIGGTSSLAAIDLIVGGNTIYFPYIGIDVGGASHSASTAGTNTVAIRDNVILFPTHIALAVGRLSSFGTTQNIAIVNNNISCDTTPADFGFALYDGFVSDFHGNDIVSCTIGTGIIPGTANGESQVASGFFSDVVGDAAVAHGLLISPSTSSGQATYLNFSRWWVGMVANETGSGVLISNPNGAYVSNISFTGGIAHGGNNGALNIIDLEDNVTNITISGNQIGADGGGTSNIGIYDNTAGQSLTITGNNFAGLAGRGTIATAIHVTNAAGDLLVITDNNFGNATNLITFDPTSPTFRATIVNNPRLSTETPSVAAAATIAAPMNERFVIAGTDTISAMTGFWLGRTVTLIPAGVALTLATGGGSGAFCNAVTTAAGEFAIATWLGSCWAVK